MNSIKKETLNWKKEICIFLSAQTISLLGSSLVQYAIIWYITLTTLSGSMMTISTLCGFLPQILISLFAGVWVDRYNRKLMVIIPDALIAISTLLVAILFIFGYRENYLLFVVLAIRSAGTGIQMPATNAIIPQLVPTEQLMKINGIYASINSIMMVLSPAVSGAILTVATIDTVFWIDIVTAIIGISLLFIIRIPTLATMHENRNKSTLTEIKAGFSYLKQHKLVLRLIIFLFVILISISPAAFLTPLLIGRSFGEEMWRLSLSEMLFSSGAALGGLLIAWWGGFKNRLHTTIFAGSLYGILMAGLGLSPFFWLYLTFNFLIGITMPCFNAPITVLLQEKVDSAMHGRIFSLVQVSNSCALPFGMVIFGPLADIYSVESLLIVGGVLVAIFSILAFSHRSLRESIQQ